MLAHEFEPEAEQRLHRAQQRLQRVRGAALLVPGKRHGDDALEGFAQHFRTPLVSETVGAAGDEHECNDVEGAETCPHDKFADRVGALGDGADDLTQQQRLVNRDHRKHDVCQGDQGETLLVGSKIAERSPVDLQQ